MSDELVEKFKEMKRIQRQGSDYEYFVLVQRAREAARKLTEQEKCD